MRRSLNLLSERFQLETLVRRRAARWAVVWAGCAAVAGLWIASSWSRNAELERVLDVRRAEVGPLDRVEWEIAGYRERLGRLEQRRSLLALLTRGDLPYRVLAFVSRGARVSDRSVRVRELTLVTEEVAATAPAAAPPQKLAESHPSHRVVVTLRGVGADNRAVTKFVAALRESRLFDHVDLKSSVQPDDASDEGRAYWIECTLPVL